MSNLPKNVKKYFWGDDLEELDWDKHKNYISKTILEKGDTDAVKWLFNQTPKQYLQKIVADPKLEPKSKNFWGIYLS